MGGVDQPTQQGELTDEQIRQVFKELDLPTVDVPAPAEKSAPVISIRITGDSLPLEPQ
jgi:hypothetical protein